QHMMVRRHSLWWGHMIIESTMLVIKHKQKCRIPKAIVLAQGIVDGPHEGLRPQRRVRRMIIVLAWEEVAWLDERESGEVLFLTLGVAEKDIHELVPRGVLGPLLVAKNKRLGDVAIVNPPGNASLIQPVINCVLVVAEVEIR